MSQEEGMHIDLIERDYITRRDMAHLGINWALIDAPEYPEIKTLKWKLIHFHRKWNVIRAMERTF